MDQCFFRRLMPYNIDPFMSHEISVFQLLIQAS